jgi:hypothetical protein
MTWRALILFVGALSIYAPFASADPSPSTESSCCAQMDSCRGHCGCTPKQTCQVSKPGALDQQAAARTAQVSPRVELELFTLGSCRLAAFASNHRELSRLPESPPLDTSQPPQAILCLWLI